MRFDRLAGVVAWLAAVLRPMLVLSVREGIGLAFSGEPHALDIQALEDSIKRLFDARPGKPEEGQE